MKTIVPSDGPPCVMIQMFSKLLAVQIEESSVTTRMTWRMLGRVMKRKRCKAEAPSTLAASYCSCGTFCSAARKEMAQKGKPRQTVAMITAGIAVERWPSQSIGVLARPSPCTPSPAKIRRR